jgi:hypothetical protein
LAEDVELAQVSGSRLPERSQAQIGFR